MNSLQSNKIDTRFKCLVDINQNKYVVIIDNNTKVINFNEVLNQIKQIIDKNISLKTHKFQIFDNYINDYIIIKSDKQIIANLSRIRVSLNNNNNNNNNNSIDKSNDKTTHRVLQTKMETKTEQSINKINKRRSHSMNSNSITSKTSVESVVNRKTKRDFYLIETVNSLIDNFITDSTNAWKLVSEKCLNFGYKSLSDSECKKLFYDLISRYVEVLENSRTIEKAAKYKSFAKLNNFNLKPFLSLKTYKKVLQLRKRMALKVEVNRSSVKTSVMPQNKVSKEENLIYKQNGNKPEVIDNRSKTRIESSLEENKSVSVQNRQKIVRNSKPFAVNKSETSNNISKSGKNRSLDKTLKEENLINKQNGNRRERRRNRTRNESSLEENELFSAQSRQKVVKNLKQFTANKSESSNNISKSNENFKITVQNVTKSGKNERKVEYDLNNCKSDSQTQNNNQLIDRAIQMCTNQDLRSNSSEENINRKAIESNEEFIHNLVSDSDLAQKVLDLTKYFITRELFIRDPSTAWQMVSFEMVFKCNYQNFTASVCENRFNELIRRYTEVFQTSINPEMARNQFNAFDIMDKIELHLFIKNPLIFRLIIDLKRKLFSASNVSKNVSQVNSFVPKAVYQKSPKSQSSVKSGKEFKKYNNNNHEFNRQYRMCSESYVDKELLDLIKVANIDENLIRDKVLNASNISEQIKCFRSEILLNKNDYEKRLKLKTKLENILKKNDFDCVLHFFGSTANSVGFRDSDIDLFIELKKINNTVKKISYKTAMFYLSGMKRVLKNNLNFFIPNPIESLRCPLIKIEFKNMSEKYRNNKKLFEELENYGISCDLSLSNGLGPHNSRLIRLFCDIEPRFQDLAIILRFWAKNNGFIGSHSNAMSSYAFTQLVIFFCQTLSPPLLPSVDYLRQLTQKSLIVDDWECSFCDDKDLIKKSDNKQTVIELLPQFFSFYSKFEFTTQVIRTKTGFAQHKYEFNSENKTSLNNKNRSRFELNFKIHCLLCIEDPFNLEHNLTANLSFAVFDRFTQYVQQIALKSESIFFNNKRNNDWGISKIITRFDPTNGYSTSFRTNGIPSLKLVLKSAQISTELIIETMVNEFCDMTLILLENVYEIDSQLTGKWDVIMEEISPFAEFTLNLKEVDLQVIDFNNRESAKSKLKKEAKGLNVFEREKAITERIINSFSDKKLSEISIKCRFILFINARISCPFIDFEIIELKPNSRAVTNFVNRLFELTPQIIDKNYYKTSDIIDTKPQIYRKNIENPLEMGSRDESIIK